MADTLKWDRAKHDRLFLLSTTWFSPGSKHSNVVLPTRLKQRKDVGYSEQLPYARRQAVELQFAARSLREKVKIQYRAQAGAVHKIHAAQVNHDTIGFRQQSSDAFL